MLAHPEPGAVQLGTATSLAVHGVDAEGKQMYLVMLLKTDLTLEARVYHYKHESQVNLNEFAEGCMGLVLVFDTYENALAFAGGRDDLVLPITPNLAVHAEEED